MSADRSWGTDTVALGRKDKSEAASQETPERRVLRPKPPAPGHRFLIVGSLALAVLLIPIALRSEGSNPPAESIRKTLKSAPPSMAKTPRRPLRRDQQPASRQQVQNRERLRPTTPCLRCRSASPAKRRQLPWARIAKPEPIGEPIPEAAGNPHYRHHQRHQLPSSGCRARRMQRTTRHTETSQFGPRYVLLNPP
jgi:hypothetical protein